MQSISSLSELLCQRLCQHAQAYWVSGAPMPPTLLLLCSDGRSVTTDVGPLLSIPGGQQTLCWVPAYFELLSGALSGCVLSFESAAGSAQAKLTVAINVDGCAEHLMQCDVQQLESGQRTPRPMQNVSRGEGEVFAIATGCRMDLRALAHASCVRTGRQFAGQLPVDALHGIAAELDRREGGVYHLTALEIAAALSQPLLSRSEPSLRVCH